jgi:tetratricopeptide (TPR) repeat protein
MDCQSFKERLESLALGIEEQGAEGSATALAAHLQECAVCRREFDVLKKAGACAHSMQDIARKLPPELVERMEQEILRRARAGSAADGRSLPAAPTAFSPRWLWRTAIGSATLAAGLVLLVCTQRSRLQEPAIPEPPVAAPAVVAASTSQALLLQAQQSFGAAARSATASGYADVVALCQRLLDQWPESAEADAALGLITSCYPLMADPEPARRALAAYALRAGERAYTGIMELPGAPEATGRKETAECRRLETIRRVFSVQIDGLFARDEYNIVPDYVSLLRTVCPEGEPAEYADFTLVRYLESIGEPALAARACEKFLAGNPRSGWGLQARRTLPTMLWNSGRREEAVEAWKAYASSSDSPREQACGYYNAGILAMGRGPVGIPDALSCFSRIPAAGAVEPYRSMAKAAQERLLQDTAKGIIDGGI